MNETKLSEIVGNGAYKVAEQSVTSVFNEVVHISTQVVNKVAWFIFVVLIIWFVFYMSYNWFKRKFIEKTN